MRQLKITQSLTGRNSKAVESYLRDISKIELINQEEEVSLAKKIKQGDEEALQKMVRANLRFVISVSKQYQNRGTDLLDLINEGNLGLIKAAKKFDETRGFKFISFAVWWVRQSILESLSNNGRLIRVPLNKIGLQNKFLTSHSKLEQKFGRQPSDEEIMEEMDIDKSEMTELLAIMSRIQSYDAPVSSNEENSQSMLELMSNFEDDTYSPDKPLVTTESMKIDLERVMSKLTLREQEVLKSYFGIGIPEPLTLDEISAMIDLTSERVRQIKERAIRRLRVYGRANILGKY